MLGLRGAPEAQSAVVSGPSEGCLPKGGGGVCKISQIQASHLYVDIYWKIALARLAHLLARCTWGFIAKYIPYMIIVLDRFYQKWRNIP